MNPLDEMRKIFSHPTYAHAERGLHSHSISYTKHVLLRVVLWVFRVLFGREETGVNISHSGGQRLKFFGGWSRVVFRDNFAPNVPASPARVSFVPPGRLERYGVLIVVFSLHKVCTGSQVGRENVRVWRRKPIRVGEVFRLNHVDNHH